MHNGGNKIFSAIGLLSRVEVEKKMTQEEFRTVFDGSFKKNDMPIVTMPLLIVAFKLTKKKIH